MGDTCTRTVYGNVAFMVVGVVALTIGADVAPDPAVSAALALGGGLLVTVVGVWSFRFAERRNDYEERYLKIGLRGAAISLWAFYWAAIAWSAVDRNTAITTPVLDPLTWLILVPVVVLPLTVWYYERVM